MIVIDKVVCVGSVYLYDDDNATGSAFIKIQYNSASQSKMRNRANSLSMTGVIAPMLNGGCKGSCGQCYDVIKDNVAIYNSDEDWTKEKLLKLIDIWQKHHMNDAHAGCEHQDSWDLNKQIPLYSYSNYATSDYGAKEYFAITRKIMEGRCLDFAEYKELTGKITLVDNIVDSWYKGAPDEQRQELINDGLLLCKQEKTEQAGNVPFQEHVEGLLGKPCEVCGYAYGTQWLYRAIPDDVISFLDSECPATKIRYAWA